MPAVGKITAKGQTTIPLEVRAALHVMPGDLITWSVGAGKFGRHQARCSKGLAMRKPLITFPAFVSSEQIRWVIPPRNQMASVCA
jgi:hypothetical protein